MVAWPWACPSPARPLESRQDLDAPQARLEDPSRRPWDRGEVGGWLAHLACVELCIGVWEASELPGTAVEVDIAGSKGGQEAQVVVHWETQAGSERLAPAGGGGGRFLVLNTSTCMPEPSVPCTCKGCSLYLCGAVTLMTAPIVSHNSL